MKPNPYQVISRTSAPFFGRDQQLQVVFERLQGNPVSVIAPRFFGKTMLLREVAKAASSHGFSQSLLWDLRHHTPVNDEEFYSSFCRELVEQVTVPDQDLHKWFQGMGTTFEVIKSVFQELDQDGIRILIVLDGIDSVLRAGAFTQNVWDNLRDLTGLACVRFLTASRSPLRQLCPPDSKTSPFWNIFHPTPVRFGAFQAGDWGSILKPFGDSGIAVDDSARKELSNWTGGIPELVVAMCEQLVLP